MTFGSFQFVTAHKSCADSGAPTMPISTLKYQHTRQQVPSAIGSTMAKTPQLEAAYSRDYQARSAPIEEVDAYNRQSTKARGHLAMQNEIMIQGEEGEQNRMAGGGAGQHTTQASKTLPIAGATSPSGHYT